MFVELHFPPRLPLSFTSIQIELLEELDELLSLDFMMTEELLEFVVFLAMLDEELNCLISELLKKKILDDDVMVSIPELL